MEKYDGWIIQSFHAREPWFMIWTFASTRKEVIEKFEEAWGKGLWKKYRRRGFHEIVKVKFVEVK